tara:strand:- start:28 stop:987 length:960 start_codon:yes stop_codon:yes gene_type:complete
MQTRTYGELFKVTSALIGTGGQLATGEQDQLRHFINRRFQQAFDESPVWPRYFVSSEERNINSHTLSGATASTSTSVNQNYRLLGSNSGDQGKKGTNVYIGVTTTSVLIYKSAADAWLVATGAGYALTADGTINITTAGTTQFTEADTNKKSDIESVETWTPRAGSDVLSIVAKNLIPYAETNKDTIGDFNRIHRKQAFINNSSKEYEFFVDFDGANVLNILNSNDKTAFVSYKKQFTPYTVTSGYYDSSLEVPAEFFNYLAHAVYADFLRVQNRQQEAISEEQVAQTYLALELEKVDIKNNNNTVNKRFSTYVNRQSR